MTLSFRKENNKYVATFEAVSDFNLHIEKAKKGVVNFYQTSSADGEYDRIKDLKFEYDDLVLDVDLSALVYPKYIKIVSYVDIAKAEVTFPASIEDNTQPSVSPNNVVCTYNVTDISRETSLLHHYALKYFTSMIVDGVEMDLDISYQFDTVGNHVVEFVLDDPTCIGDKAFYNIEGLTSVTIPNSVTSIGGNTFVACMDLASITCYATTAPSISYTFGELPTVGTLYVPIGSDYSSWMSNDGLGYYSWAIEYI